VTHIVDWTTFASGAFSKLTTTTFFVTTFSISRSTRRLELDFAFAIAVCVRQAFAVMKPMRIATDATVRSVVGRALGPSGTDTIAACALFVTITLCVRPARSSQLHKTTFEVTVTVLLALRLE